MSGQSLFRFSTVGLLLVVLAIAYVLGAFCRGSYVFGTGGGIAYGLTAGLIVLQFYYALNQPKRSWITIALLVLFAIPISVIGAMPTLVRSDIRNFAVKQVIERNARTELTELIQADPAFGNVNFYSSTRYRLVHVNIWGQVPAARDLSRLKAQIENRPALQKCSIRYTVQVQGKP